MSFFDDSSSGFAAFGGEGAFFRSSAAPFGGSSSDKGGAARATKPEGRRSGGSWAGADNSGFWSEEGASFSSPSPSQTHGEHTIQRRGGHALSTASPGGGGLIYATVGMLLRAAEEAAPSRRSRVKQQGGAKGEAGPPEELSSSSTGGLKLQLHGQELTTVGLRGWVSAAGAQHLPSAVRFILCDGTGELDVEVGLVGGRPWWGDNTRGASSSSSGGQGTGEDDEAAAAAALWNFQGASCDGKGKRGKHVEASFQQEKDTTIADEPTEDKEEGAQKEEALQESSVSKKTEEHQNRLMRKFLEPGSLVRVSGALLLLANDGAASRRRAQKQETSNSESNEENAPSDEEHNSVEDAPRVYLEAITCAPIKDAREFSVLHPVEVAFAAATFLSRSGRLTQPALIPAIHTGEHKKAKLQPKEEEDDADSVKQTRAQTENEDAAKQAEHLKLLQQDYGHLEDPVQQKVILYLLQHGDSEKRVSKQRLLAHLCSEAVADHRCSTEQVEKALQELEEAAETIEHAGLVALAC